MLILCLLVSVAYAQSTLLQVNTTEGVVVGASASNGSYYAFYDIPYAGPTSGENRFKAPTPPTSYTGVFNATDRNIVCAQPSANGLVGIEDCLTLSVFTTNVTTPKPVFVWLNAEEYTTTTTTSFSYRNIVETDIVFVSINFRLSVFGFLCLGVPDAPGNAGLKDIIQGLLWLKANIANFGGDPSNVVLIGHGSGAALVDLLTMSPRTENLIHKAIALSGSALAPWAVAYDPIGYANLFGARLNYTGQTQEQLASLLKNTDINLMTTVLYDFKFTNNTPLFAPCLEDPKLNPNETVLLDAPMNLLKSGNYHDIPYIAGYTTREGTLRAGEAAVGQWLALMEANFANFLPVDLDMTGNAILAQIIRQFYFSESPIAMSTINNYLDYQGDTLIIMSVIRAARARALTSTNSVRLLEFGVTGTLNSDWPYNQIPLTGARHGAFLNFLFKENLLSSELTIMRSLVSRFSVFAYTGQPVPGPTWVIWRPITANIINYIEYSGNVGNFNITLSSETIRTNPFTANLTFWDDVYSRYYRAPEPLSSAQSGISARFLLMFSPLILFFL